MFIKVKNMNKNTKENYAKSYIDLGQNIFKAIMISVWVLPLSLTISSPDKNIFNATTTIPANTAYTILTLVIIGAIVGLAARSYGFNLLNEVTTEE
jgi:hypothetical protein